MYQSSNGRFDHLDPFFGDKTDPQSFHKYGYVHGDPVNGIDPTGESFHDAFDYGNLMAARNSKPAIKVGRLGPVRVGNINKQGANVLIDSFNEIWVGLFGSSTDLKYLIEDEVYGIGELRDNVGKEGYDFSLTALPANTDMESNFTGTAGGFNRKVLIDNMTDSNWTGGNTDEDNEKRKKKHVGVTGLATCVGVIIKTDKHYITTHIQPGRESGVETLRRLGPYPEGSTMVIFGATDRQARDFSEYQINELIKYAKDNGIKIEGFLSQANLYVNKQGEYFYKPDRDGEYFYDRASQ